VAATETALAQLLAADLSTLDLVGLMIDGVHFGEHCCVVALGIDIDGTKHPLALVEGSTENATLVTELIVWGSRTRAWRLICVQAAVSYSLRRPPRISRRRILPWTGSGTGDVGRGGRKCSARCGRAVL